MTISNSQMEQIKKMVYRHTGIQLTDDKKIMITNRIHKVLTKHLNFPGTLDDFLKVAETKYLEEFINVFTTNKTNFFREIQHFNFMYNEILDDFVNNNKQIKIYCSASSTGQEPWSILGTVAEKMKKAGKTNLRAGVEFLATDIDTSILKRARAGEYECVDVNKQMLPTWFTKETLFDLPPGGCRKTGSSYDDYATVKIRDEIKALATFKQMNLMNTTYMGVQDNYYDIVFCRNVLIYFSKEDQNAILKRLLKKVKVGGYLMLGHSESPLDIEPFLEKKNYNIFKRIQ